MEQHLNNILVYQLVARVYLYMAQTCAIQTQKSKEPTIFHTNSAVVSYK